MNVINVQNVTKTYRVGVGRARVREMLPAPLDGVARRVAPEWWSRDTFNALEDISFNVAEGTALGVVGHNGAGKTTLLRVISGITAPTHGSAPTRGRVEALIDVLVGFNPELTGRENIYLLAAIYGVGRRGIGEKVDEIFEFAEIRELADTPVKRYSTGMGARLGFSTIISLAPEVLLIDEVLAVGDAGFQRKCIERLDRYHRDGGTLVFISHNLALVRHMTQRVIWLEHGHLVKEGATAEILAEYARAMEVRSDVGTAHRGHEVRRMARSYGMDRWGFGGIRVEEAHVEQTKDHSMIVHIVCSSREDAEARLAVGLIGEEGTELGGTVSHMMRFRSQPVSTTCTIEPLPLRPGIYFPVISVRSADGTIRDRWRLERAVVVEANGRHQHAVDLGPIEMPGTWRSD